MSSRKEEQIRLRIESIYNKTAGDFASKREYDDYLEEREDIMYSLTEGENVAETEARVRAYERANRASILENEARKGEAKRLRSEQHAPKAASAEAGDGPGDGLGAPGAASYAAPALPAPAAAPPQPQPAAAGEQDNGHAFGKQLTPEEAYQVALICGWSPDFKRQRLRQEAFCCLLSG